jgi:hypothetical protein
MWGGFAFDTGQTYPTSGSRKVFQVSPAEWGRAALSRLDATSTGRIQPLWIDRRVLILEALLDVARRLVRC